MKWNELKAGAWSVSDFLTRQECERLMIAAEEVGMKSTLESGEDSRNRIAEFVRLEDAELSQRVFERIRSYVPQDITVSSDLTVSEGFQFVDESLGRWRPSGLNEQWLIVRYPAGIGHFGPHRDSVYIKSKHCRSFFTIAGYLTDRPLGSGGATRLLRNDIHVLLDEATNRFSVPKDSVEYRVEADQAGKAVVFLHGYMHDGEVLTAGSPPKWLFRTDIMYQRDPASAPSTTLQEDEAKEWLRKAEEAENKKEIQLAIQCYRRAYKLDPTLEFSC